MTRLRSWKTSPVKAFQHKTAEHEKRRATPRGESYATSRRILCCLSQPEADAGCCRCASCRLHTKGGPLRFTAQGYTELVDAFYRIARDRENKIDIPTGGRGEFIGPDGPRDHSKIWRDANLIFDRASFCRIHGSWSFLPTGEGDYWSSDL